MTTGEKALIAITVAGVLYLIVKRAAAQVPQRAVPERIANRVMDYSALLLRYGAEQGVDPALIAAVISVESAGDPNAFGSAGEVGLMQVLPSTAKWIMRVESAQLYDPATNIQTGTAYLRYCIDRKGGNVTAGICGYNYGPDRVGIVGGVIQAPESVKAYARNVMSFVEAYRAFLRARLGSFYENIFGSGEFILTGLPCWGCYR